MNRMRICVVAYKFGTEDEIGKHLGTYHYFIEKMRRVAAAGHTIIIVAPWLTWRTRGSTSMDGIPIKRYWPPLMPQWWARLLQPFLRWLYIKQTQRQALACASAMHADVVYVWQARETGYAVSRISQRLPCPFIFRQITAWQWHFERGLRGTATQKKYARAIYAAADAVVLLSEAAVDEAVTFGLDRRKARVIGVAIEEQLFAPAHDQGFIKKTLGLSYEKIILFIGRVNFAEKGVGVLIEAVPHVLKTVPDAHLLIIGSGEIEHAEALIQNHAISDHVHLLGRRPFADLVHYIQACDAFAVPSLWMEAFGQVTIEAMSCGVPVVTSDAGASPEINIDGETGFVTPAGNVEMLADALIKLLNNESLRRQMGEAGRKRVLAHFTYEVMVKKFLSVCEEAIYTNKTPLLHDRA